MKPVVCIAGPTASGKSDWAVRIAKNIDGEIINADSMQVYRDLRVLSARPSREDEQGVVHHLFGHVEGTVRYSVGEWLRDVVPIILDCLAREKTPILTGGTGLYFKALFEGLADVPDPGKAGREAATALLERGIDHLKSAAAELDPVAAARIQGDDTQRLLRIVSVAKGTKKRLSTWRRDTRPIIPPRFWIGAIMFPDRSALYEKINQRYDTMVVNGGLREAEALMARNIDPSLPVMKAIGVPPLLRHLDGKISLDEAISQAKRDTRRFAKRQYTWFRSQNAQWHYITTDLERSIFEKKIPKNCI